MTEEINGVQKKVVKSLTRPNILGLYYYGIQPEKSNKELSNDLNESGSNINYATDKLQEKGIVKDTTSPLENNKTNYRLNQDVDIEKTYHFGSIIDNTAKVHALSAVIIFLYSIILATPVYQYKGLFLAVFMAGLAGLIPSFFYNIYRIWRSLDSYKLHVQTGE